MTTLALIEGDFAYDLLVMLHILAAVIGFGSTFVWPLLAVKNRSLGRPDIGYEVSKMSMESGKILSSPFIYATGVLGIILVAVGDGPAFDQFWVSAALGLFIVGVGVSAGLHLPNLNAMLALQKELVAAGPPPENAASMSPPPQVMELMERGKKAGMYGGILHLLFLLLLIDMVFKPGL